MSTHTLPTKTLTEQEVAEIVTMLEALKAKFDFLITLTAQERRQLPKLGERSIGFEEKCAQHMASHPEFLPGFVALDEINLERTLRGQLMRCFAPLQALSSAMEDTLMAVGSDIWLADLAFYHSAQDAARRKLPGAEAICNDLSSRFPGGGRKKETAEPVPA
ncbi:hypothetical protein [Methylotetracoccus oryzae]|uniref:hypothetical protein n=1 Tax=Methylotetracoccus oryzae TaxID=1919059 RepID=UPI00111A3B6E|nr:hypothetical protein [Methylotetracoccus oryzae]